MFNVGTVTQFDDVNSLMDPQILIAAKAISLGMNKGAVYQLMNAPLVPLANGRFEVAGRTLTAQKGSLSAAINDAVTNVALNSTAGVIVGAVLKIEDELMVVKSVNSATEVTVYSRGAGGTTAAPHSTGVAWEVTSYANLETDIQNIDAISENTEVFENYAQLFVEPIEYTRCAQLARQGLEPAQIDAILIQEALARVLGKVSYTALNGLKDAGNKSNPRMTAGVYQQFLNTSLPTLNFDATGNTFDENILKQGIENAATYGDPNVIIVSSKTKGIINGFDRTSTAVDVTRPAGSTIAGNYVETYIYEGKALQIVVDADAADDKVVIANQANLKKGWCLGETLQVVDEPALSSRVQRKTIQGVIGFAVENPIEGSCIYNIG
jgi:hypothetical protein